MKTVLPSPWVMWYLAPSTLSFAQFESARTKPAYKSAIRVGGYGLERASGGRFAERHAMITIATRCS